MRSLFVLFIKKTSFQQPYSFVHFFGVAVYLEVSSAVIVNFRATFEWTYELALTGICYNGVVSIGTLGCLKDNESRTLLRNSVKALVECIKPRIIIVYGYAPNDIFQVARDGGADIWQFDSEISKAFGGHRYGNEI